MRRVELIIICATLLMVGCEGTKHTGVSPGMTFDAPSMSAIMLTPPTQVQQGDKPWCAPAAAVTLYKTIVQQPYDLSVAVREMGTDNEGTQISNFVNWMNNHQLKASLTTIPTTAAVEFILSQIKAGYYCIPYVNENGKPNSTHVLVVYGIDNNRVLISDSNRHLGMNRIGVDKKIFRDQWLINVGTTEGPEALLMFVDRHPRVATSQKTDNAGAFNVDSKYDSLLVR